MEISNKIVLVTGGSQGLGATLCRHFAACGAHVLVNCAHNRSGAEAVAAEIGGEACVFDIADEPAVRQFFGKHPIDILINNARLDPYKRPESMSDGDWFDRMLAVNLKGPYLCSLSAIEQMRKAGQGSIINISSVWAKRAAKPPMLEYAMSKAALHCLTRSLALMAADAKITVNAVSPGLILSPQMHERLTNAELAKLTKQIPLKRGAQPEEIAAAVEFLVRHDYTTGEILNVNGGSDF
ncbi:MAG: SDR family oxidoreductase [Lentisphaeria bacterium]|nr:SDR family oxidoreductase [Lentisphaeria bacterium]